MNASYGPKLTCCLEDILNVLVSEIIGKLRSVNLENAERNDLVSIEAAQASTTRGHFSVVVWFSGERRLSFDFQIDRSYTEETDPYFSRIDAQFRPETSFEKFIKAIFSRITKAIEEKGYSNVDPNLFVRVWLTKTIDADLIIVGVDFTTARIESLATVFTLEEDLEA